MITVVFLLLLLGGNCWFPFSHQYWTCLLVQGDVQKCFYDNKDIQLTSATLGGSSPDAVKKLGLHNLYYAVFQYFYARDVYTNKTADFDPESFSLGFIFHLIEDSIGHGKGGFINEAEDFSLCVSVDSYHYYESGFDTKHFFPAKYLDTSATNFVYFSQLEYGKEYPTKYPKVASRSELDSSILELEGIITGEKEVVKLFKSQYKGNMEKESKCGTQTFPNAVSELNLSYEWMNDVAKNVVGWVKQSKDIPTIITQIETGVQNLFKSHNNTICIK